ncbi:hypothetical protein TNCV_5053191 [Trichonephila clavipes]|nr:hypothetical protein TNCV_5053191 [Trichonephila clavipes]
MAGQIYRVISLKQRVRIVRGAMNVEFVFLDDKVCSHLENIISECLLSEDIIRTERPDLNLIENRWSLLGRQVAAHQQL